MAKILSKRYKGSKGSTTTASTIPEWAVPYIMNVGNQAQASYGAGDLSKVAGTNKNLDFAFGQGAQMTGENAAHSIAQLSAANANLSPIASGVGYDTKAMKDAAILEASSKTAELGKDYGARGTLGSARQGVQQGAQNAATEAQFAKIDYDENQRKIQSQIAASQAIGQNATSAANIGESTLRGAVQTGTAQRGIEQEQADAGWQGLQRYASTIYGNPARNQTVATSGGGK